MAISLKTRKMLWGRAANRCALESCRKELVIDATETDDESLVGEECHIIAKKSDGPRGTSTLTQLEALGEWLFSRVWPKRYPEIESSLQNFRLVLQDFINVFAEYSEPYGKNMLGTKKFYQINEWNPEKYELLGKKHEYHVDLVQDLILELTRAANYVCDKTREWLFHTYRLNDGVLLVTHGPYQDLMNRTSRCEYRGEERTNKPYPGLDEFKQLRTKRDLYFGSEDPP